jgi:hypothetical protein
VLTKSKLGGYYINVEFLESIMHFGIKLFEFTVVVGIIILVGLIVKKIKK